MPSLFVRPIIGLLLFCALLVGVAALVGQGMPRRVIAFVTTSDYNPKLHLMDVQSRIVRRISDLPVFSCCPKWSPDGTAIAFNGNNEQNYVVNIYDGKTRRLTPSDWSGWVMGWSADGQQVILRTLDATNGSLYQVDVDGENLMLLAEGASNSFYLPQLSPDSRFAYYAVRLLNGNDWKIFRLNLEEGVDQLLLNEKYDGTQVLSLSPDGQRAAYASTQGREVILMNTDGSDLKRLKTTADMVGVIWSPDSQQILFLGQDAAGVPDVYVTDANGQNPHDLHVQDAVPTLSDLTWSPDGTQIVFVSQSIGEKTDLYVMDADGKNLQRLTFNAANNIYPAWQPGT
jgi:TolB protein